jgi:RNA polymerase sigma-70 factor (ECF subfamily)
MEPKSLRQNHPGESATRTMTTHPDHGQDVPMTPTVDRLAGSDSPLASRDPELTARFVNDALPYLNHLDDRARRLTCNGVDAEDLVQETMLRAYAGFNTFSEGTNFRAWLFRIMTNTYINFLLRAQHRPSEYLIDHITDRQLAAQDRQSSDWPRSFELDALDALPDIQLADVLMTLPMQFRLTVYDRDIAELRRRESAEIIACCEGTVMSRLHRGRQGLRALLPTTHEPTSVPVRRRRRGRGVEAGSSFWRWVRPSSSLFFAQPELGDLRLFP